MKSSFRRKFKIGDIKLIVIPNSCVEFDDFDTSFKQRVIFRNNEYSLSRDSFTPAQTRSIKMLEKLEAFFLIYL